MKCLISILFCFKLSVGFSQKILEIDITRANNFKSIQLFNNDYLEYKLKDDHKYRIGKIVNLKDSLVIFDNDSVIKLSQIKVIKLRDANFMYQLFSSFFYTGAILFVGLDTFNNIINSQTPCFNQTAVIVSVALVASGYLIKQLSIKRIRFNNRKTLRIIDANYQKLNSKN